MQGIDHLNFSQTNDNQEENKKREFISSQHPIQDLKLSKADSKKEEEKKGEPKSTQAPTQDNNN